MFHKFLLLLLLLLLHLFNGLFSRTTWVTRHQKSRTILVNQSGFTGARDSEWQWHQLGDMQICTSLQTDNHASTPPLSFLQTGCPSCCPTNSIKALKAENLVLYGPYFPELLMYNLNADIFIISSCLCNFLLLATMIYSPSNS